MKILMINSVCGIRSTGRICTDLASALEARGHEVRIAYGREEVPEKFQKYAVRIGRSVDIYLHVLKARLTDGAGLGSRRATEKFIKWVKQYNPDVIHLHNIHGYYINIEVLFEYLRTCGKKIIWTLHDCWAFTGHSALCDMVGCRKWEEGCKNCPQLSEYPKSLVDHSESNYRLKKNIFSGVPNLEIVTPSEWLAGQTRKTFLAEYEIKVIKNGIDTSVFCPTDSSFRKENYLENRFVALGVSNVWNQTKGFSDYIKLATMLPENFCIVLVGVTKKQKKKLPPNMIGIERTNNQRELAALYTTADCFVNLTYCDTYPTVNLEALACGIPVLTYDTGGSSESAGETGYVFPKGDIQSVAEFLLQHTDMPTIDSAVKHYKEMLEDYCEIYNVIN